MARIIRSVVSEFARRPVSNTFMAIGGILLTKSVSNYLDRLERDKLQEDMRPYYPAPLGEIVELDTESPDVPHFEYAEENQND